ncbi:gamma-glutamylcyclotransferase-like isoform X1 [Mustelus asterias]
MNRCYLVLGLCLCWPIYGGIKTNFTSMEERVNGTERRAVLVGEEGFCYFGYGSNLLRERLQLRNPSAVQVAVGCLKGYKLAFGTCNGCESYWGGGVATIIPSPEDDVWGVVWRLKAADRRTLDEQSHPAVNIAKRGRQSSHDPLDLLMATLARNRLGKRSSCSLCNRQEGVSSGIYSPIEVRIQQENTGKEITCLTYQLNNSNFTLPSPIYKEVIYTGAKRSGLPAEYLKKLDAIRSNNYNGTTQFIMEIRAMLNQLQNNTVKY